MLRRCPDVYTVVGDVDRHIADDLDAFFVGIIGKQLPLGEEFKLAPAPEIHFLFKFTGAKPGLRVIAMLGLPLRPLAEAVVNFQRHKQRVIFQPRGVSLYKAAVCLIRFEAGVSGAQNGIAVIKEPAIVDALAAASVCVQLLLCQQALLRQNVQINKIRITGLGGRGLVGAVTVGCGIQR